MVTFYVFTWTSRSTHTHRSSKWTFKIAGLMGSCLSIICISFLRLLLVACVHMSLYFFAASDVAFLGVVIYARVHLAASAVAQTVAAKRFLG